MSEETIRDAVMSNLYFKVIEKKMNVKDTIKLSFEEGMKYAQEKGE